MIAAIATVICGKSALQELYSKEYIISWSIITGMYLVGIYVIVKRKNQRGKQKYIKNMDNEKRIQLPEYKIVKIEYLIQNLEEPPKLVLVSRGWFFSATVFNQFI